MSLSKRKKKRGGEGRGGGLVTASVNLIDKSLLTIRKGEKKKEKEDGVDTLNVCRR